MNHQINGDIPSGNIAMENGPFIDYFPIKTSIYKGFSMAMLNNQRVYTTKTINAIWSEIYNNIMGYISKWECGVMGTSHQCMGTL